MFHLQNFTKPNKTTRNNDNDNVNVNVNVNYMFETSALQSQSLSKHYSIKYPPTLFSFDLQERSQNSRENVNCKNVLTPLLFFNVDQ